MRTILFVCTGNSCRSVMASEMLKKMLNAGKDKIQVFSAGIGTIQGMMATDNTISILQREGIDAAGHRSTPILRATIENADLILVMENFHKQRILELAPKASGKVYLLREFQKDTKEVIEPEISDPVGKPMEVYERTFELIKEGLDNLMKWLKESGWI